MAKSPRKANRKPQPEKPILRSFLMGPGLGPMPTKPHAKQPCPHCQSTARQLELALIRVRELATKCNALIRAVHEGVVPGAELMGVEGSDRVERVTSQ